MRSLFRLEFMHLLDVNSKTTSGVETARTHAAFEVFGLLMLHEDWRAISVSDAREMQVTNPSHLQTHVHSTSTKDGESRVH